MIERSEYVGRGHRAMVGIITVCVVVIGLPMAASAQYYVLDGFGGVHRGGPMIPSSPATPYFGFNIARAIAHRTVPPRLNYHNGLIFNVSLTSNVNLVVVSTTLTLPDDGFVATLANLSMGSVFATETGEAVVCVGVDGTMCLGAVDRPVTTQPGQFASVAISQATFLTAGAHTINLLARKVGTAGETVYYSPTIVAIFIDQNGVGGS